MPKIQNLRELRFTEAHRNGILVIILCGISKILDIVNLGAKSSIFWFAVFNFANVIINFT